MPYGITHSYLQPGTGSISRPYPGRDKRPLLDSIYPSIKDEWLSRPEPTQVNYLPRVATEVPAIPGVGWLSWPSAPLLTVGVNTAVVLVSQAKVIIDPQRTWPSLTSVRCITHAVLMDAGFCIPHICFTLMCKFCHVNLFFASHCLMSMV